MYSKASERATATKALRRSREDFTEEVILETRSFSCYGRRVPKWGLRMLSCVPLYDQLVGMTDRPQMQIAPLVLKIFFENRSR